MSPSHPTQKNPYLKIKNKNIFAKKLKSETKIHVIQILLDSECKTDGEKNNFKIP